MDPLSKFVSAARLQNVCFRRLRSGGGDRPGVPKHTKGHRKCYAVTSKPCWVAIEGVPDAVRLKAGDCFILPRGLPFCVATDLSGQRARFIPELADQTPDDALDFEGTGRAFLLGGHFLLTGSLSITCLFLRVLRANMGKHAGTSGTIWPVAAHSRQGFTERITRYYAYFDDSVP